MIIYIIIDYNYFKLKQMVIKRKNDSASPVTPCYVDEKEKKVKKETKKIKKETKETKYAKMMDTFLSGINSDSEISDIDIDLDNDTEFLIKITPKKYTCEFCGDDLSSYMSLWNHKKKSKICIKYRNATFKCKYCEFTSNYIQDINSHQKDCKGCKVIITKKSESFSKTKNKKATPTTPTTITQDVSYTQTIEKLTQEIEDYKYKISVLEIEKFKSKLYKHLLEMNTDIALGDIMEEKEDGLHLYNRSNNLSVFVESCKDSNVTLFNKNSRTKSVEEEGEQYVYDDSPLLSHISNPTPPDCPCGGGDHAPVDENSSDELQFSIKSDETSEIDETSEEKKECGSTDQVKDKESTDEDEKYVEEEDREKDPSDVDDEEYIEEEVIKPIRPVYLNEEAFHHMMDKEEALFVSFKKSTLKEGEEEQDRSVNIVVQKVLKSLDDSKTKPVDYQQLFLDNSQKTEEEFLSKELKSHYAYHQVSHFDKKRKVKKPSIKSTTEDKNEETRLVVNFKSYLDRILQIPFLDKDHLSIKIEEILTKIYNEGDQKPGVFNGKLVFYIMQLAVVRSRIFGKVTLEEYVDIDYQTTEKLTKILMARKLTLADTYKYTQYSRNNIDIRINSDCTIGNLKICRSLTDSEKKAFTYTRLLKCYQPLRFVQFNRNSLYGQLNTCEQMTRPIEYILADIIPNEFGYHNIIYLNIPTSKLEDLFSFYILQHVSNTTRYWKLESRLTSLCYTLADQITSILINLFRRLYKNMYGHNNYPYNYSSSSTTGKTITSKEDDRPIFTEHGKEELQNLLRSIRIVSKVDAFRDLLRLIIFKHCSYTPTENDKFDWFIYSPDVSPQALGEYSSHPHEICHKLFNYVDKDQLFHFDSRYMEIELTIGI